MSIRHSDRYFEEGARPIGQVAARSGVVALVSNQVQMALGIGTTLVLVRILKPADFGVFAIAWVVVQLTATVRDVGISTAIVNAESITRERVSGIFWSGQIVNLAATVLIALLGPVLAHVYEMPKLTEIMPVIALASLLTGLTSVHDGLLKRSLRFGLVATKDITSMACGAAAAITVGLLGFGVWALAAQQLAIAAAGLVVCLACTAWVPEPPLRSLRAAAKDRSMLRHGTFLSLSKCISTLGASADRLILGSLVPQRTLGLYQQAFVWSEFPSRQIYNPMLGVVVSAFSRKQKDEASSYRAAFRQAVLILYAVCVPMLLFGAIRGELVIRVLLGSQWAESSPFFSILCLAMLFRLVVQASKWVYLAESRSGDQLIWTLTFVPSMILAVATGAMLGKASGVCLALLIVHAIAAPLAIWFSTRRSRLSPSDMVSPAIRPLTASVLASFSVLWLSPPNAQASSSALALLTGVLMFVLFNAVAWILPGAGRGELRECVHHLSPRLAKSIDHSFGRATRSAQVP